MCTSGITYRYSFIIRNPHSRDGGFIAVVIGKIHPLLLGNLRESKDFVFSLRADLVNICPKATLAKLKTQWEQMLQEETDEDQ